MPRTHRASRVIGASVDRVFDALTRREAMLAWLPPAGMTGCFERFDLQPGGSYRLLLTYDDPSAGGKTGGNSDVVDVRIVDMVANDRVVQAVDFVSAAPQFTGTMTMTWSVRAVDGGTQVEILADDVPDGISEADHAAGMSSSLDNLARYLAR